MKVKNNPENWPMTKLRARVDEIYKEMRTLSAKLLELNINQYDGALVRSDAYAQLSELANTHIDLEEELFKIEKIIEERKMKKSAEDKSLQ